MVVGWRRLNLDVGSLSIYPSIYLSIYQAIHLQPNKYLKMCFVSTFLLSTLFLILSIFLVILLLTIYLCYLSI